MGSAWPGATLAPSAARAAAKVAAITVLVTFSLLVVFQSRHGDHPAAAEISDRASPSRDGPGGGGHDRLCTVILCMAMMRAGIKPSLGAVSPPRRRDEAPDMRKNCRLARGAPDVGLAPLRHAPGPARRCRAPVLLSTRSGAAAQAAGVVGATERMGKKPQVCRTYWYFPVFGIRSRPTEPRPSGCARKGSADLMLTLCRGLRLSEMAFLWGRTFFNSTGPRR